MTPPTSESLQLLQELKKCTEASQRLRKWALEIEELKSRERQGRGRPFIDHGRPSYGSGYGF